VAHAPIPEYVVGARILTGILGGNIGEDPKEARSVIRNALAAQRSTLVTRMLSVRFSGVVVGDRCSHPRAGVVLVPDVVIPGSPERFSAIEIERGVDETRVD
jgi:hypothetical protein